MATTQELATLAASTGRDRDILFLTLMIRHHRGSLAMARTLANTPPAPRSAPWPPRSSSPNRLTSPPSKQTYAASAPQPPDPSQPAATRDPPPGARASVRNGHRPCPHVGTTQGQRRDGFLMRRSVGRRPAVRARRVITNRRLLALRCSPRLSTDGYRWSWPDQRPWHCANRASAPADLCLRNSDDHAD